MAIVTRVYRSTHVEQQWVVPAGVTSVVMEAWGGIGGCDGNNNVSIYPYPQGATARSSPSAADSVGWYASPYWNGTIKGGAGPAGYVAGTLAVSAGTTYYLYVGGNGHNSDYAAGPFGGDTATATAGGGFNGGGLGGASYYKSGATDTWTVGGGGGGGATDVRVGGNAVGNRVLVAGGSGGAGAWWANRNYSAYGMSPFSPVVVAYNPQTTPYYTVAATPYFIGGSGMGGYGGGGAGERGTKGDLSGLAAGLAAQGGTASAAGAAGTDTETDGHNGTAGSSNVGGNGGGWTSGTPAVSMHGGGGGGGGYFGGGGGATGHQNASPARGGAGGGGGGGSNFIGGSFTGGVSASHLWQDISVPVEYQWTTLPLFLPGGAIRLTYTQAPNAPTIITPGSQGRVPVNVPFDITWLWTSAAAADIPDLGEGGAEITWTRLGVDTVTFVPPQVAGAANNKTLKYTIPANTLTANSTYTLKIRVYDAQGSVSAFSATTTFRAITSPLASTITTPAANADMTPASFNVTWTNPNTAGSQYLYRVRVTGDTSGAVLDTGLLHGGSRVNLHPDPTMRLNSTGLWTVTSGTLATDTKVDPWGTAACYKLTWSTKTRVTIPIPTVSGVQYTFSGYWAAAVSTDPAMALAAFDGVSGVLLGQSATQAVAGTPTNWQRLSVTFTAISGNTLFAFVPVGGSTSVNYVSSSQVEVGPIGLYFSTSSSKDPGVTGTITTNTSGNIIVVNSDVLTVALGPWPNGSEWVDISLWTSSYDSVEYQALTALTHYAKVNLNPPGTPTVTIAKDDTVGSITLHITAVDTPNLTTSVDIYRSIVGQTAELHIANVVPPVGRVFDFVDYTPGSDVLYQYRVHANSVAGGFEDVT